MPFDERLTRALCALEGLSIGDAFGERWFYSSSAVAPMLIQIRALPDAIWDYTDDTQMALSIVSILRQHQRIDQEALALNFARHYNPIRKYGAAMRGLFLQITEGINWQVAASSLFEGQGSFGNGAAMRVAPLGAYFADDMAMVVEQAYRSAVVTHAHPEGIAGAVAVAVAAATAWQLSGSETSREKFIERVLPYVPPSEVRQRLEKVQSMQGAAFDVVDAVGNGMNISAQDTVPFCIWSAASHLPHYEEALWHTASVGGDIDTNCAIVGGIVAMFTGLSGIPSTWQAHREPLPSWHLME